MNRAIALSTGGATILLSLSCQTSTQNAASPSPKAAAASTPHHISWPGTYTEELLAILSLTGHELPDHCWGKRNTKLSKLVLTVGRYGHPPYGAHYEIGFYDGEMFRGLHGYRIYPDPTHWIQLPKPPVK